MVKSAKCVIRNTTGCALCLDHPSKCIDRSVKVILIQHTVFCCCSIKPSRTRGLDQDATSSSNGHLGVSGVVLEVKKEMLARSDMMPRRPLGRACGKRVPLVEARDSMCMCLNLLSEVSASSRTAYFLEALTQVMVCDPCPHILKVAISLRSNMKHQRSSDTARLNRSVHRTIPNLHSCADSTSEPKVGVPHANRSGLRSSNVPLDHYEARKGSNRSE